MALVSGSADDDADDADDVRISMVRWTSHSNEWIGGFMHWLLGKVGWGMVWVLYPGYWIGLD